MGIDPNTIAAGLIIATAHPIVVETFKFGLDLLKDQISTNKSAAYEKGLENFIDNMRWDTGAVVFYAYLNFIIYFFCTYYYFQKQQNTK